MPWDVLKMSWAIAFVVFVVVEAFTAGVVSIWFAFGALGALAASFFGLNSLWQVVIFFIVSAVMLIFTRPIAKNWLNVKVTKTNADAILGKTGVVTKPIFENEYGEVKVAGQRWTAKSVSCPIELNEQVEIIAIEGVKVIVNQVSRV